MTTMTVPASAPSFSEEDIADITSKLADVLRRKAYLTMGSYGEQFERAFAEYAGVRHAVACNSGTSALEMIFRAKGIQGKEVIVPSNTFIATALAVMNAGGKVVFADVGDDMCIDPADVARKITVATAAVVVVHIGGIVSLGIEKLKALLNGRNIALIEDAAQAHGSELRGVKAAALGYAAGFSFFPTKVMTTGEGGMVTTNDAALAEKMRSLREFGKASHGIYTNYHTAFGYNWRMPEVAAIIGLRQLASLAAFIRRRGEIAAIYDRALENARGVRMVHATEPSKPNWFKYIVVLEEHDRAEVHRAMQKAGVSPSGYVYEVPLHKQPLFRGAQHDSLPRTEFFAARHFCLPIFPAMTDEEAAYVVRTFLAVLDHLPRART